jgi:predicted metal-dependent phosphoesterase TrpH
MTAVRIGGLTAVAAALVAGTLLDRPASRQVPRHQSYFVLQGDFHVHAFPGDGGIPAWELRAEAARRGLDVFVVSNHNQRLAAAMATASLAPRGEDVLPIVLPGQEITAPRFHMIAAGIAQTIDWRLTAAEAIRAVHAQGGVAIAAHPITEGGLSWFGQSAEALSLLDGSEAAHPTMIRARRQGRELYEFYRHAASANPSLAPIGSSDFHWGGMMGRCRTFLFTREITGRSVLDAIRDGRTVAFGDDQFVGDAELVAAARAIVVAGLPGVHTPRAIAIVNYIALAGLLMLILLR